MVVVVMTVTVTLPRTEFRPAAKLFCLGRGQKSALIGWCEECGVSVATPCDF